MKRFIETYFIFLSLLAALGVFVYLAFLMHHKGLGTPPDTVERIRQSGTLRLITTRAVNTFYIYNGRPGGFEYDLALSFADYLNVELDIVTPGWNNLFTYLEQGKGDMIAAGLTITKERLERFAFSIPYMSIQQKVIHHSLDFSPKTVKDLNFRTLHVRRGTSYHSRLEELKQSGIDFKYILHDNIPTEELIAMVHNRQIKLTVADSNIAMLAQRYYPEIRIGTPIQKKESLSWAVRKGDMEMLKEINRFFLWANETGRLEQLIAQYYPAPKNFGVFELKTFYKRIRTRLPKYQKSLQTESVKYGFDWRLMAAVMYQESHFDPNAKSVTNVRGLMQLTHATAREMGVTNRMNPSQSIRAGIKYLNRMYEKFNGFENDYQRMIFALASYNIGYGHVLDAMAMARERGLDDQSWHALKKMLPLLTKPAYYKKTKYGYARGWEPVHYVERVLTYFDILRKMDIS